MGNASSREKERGDTTSHDKTPLFCESKEEFGYGSGTTWHGIW